MQKDNQEAFEKCVNERCRIRNWQRKELRLRKQRENIFHFSLNLDVNRKKEDAIGFREIYILFNMAHIQKDTLIIYAQVVELSE